MKSNASVLGITFSCMSNQLTNEIPRCIAQLNNFNSVTAVQPMCCVHEQVVALSVIGKLSVDNDPKSKVWLQQYTVWRSVALDKLLEHVVIERRGCVWGL